jgi:hypothetical protein
MIKALQIPENITYEFIDANVYILDINNGEYYELSKSASIIWREIAGGKDIYEIKKKLQSLFIENKRIDDDIDEAIKNFIKLGFIEDN